MIYSSLPLESHLTVCKGWRMKSKTQNVRGHHQRVGRTGLCEVLGSSRGQNGVENYSCQLISDLEGKENVFLGGFLNRNQ